MNDINSSFGKGSVTRLGSAGGALVYAFHSHDFCLPYNDASVFVLCIFHHKGCTCTHKMCLCCSETFPSGCLTLDFALGGGLPRGRIVEVVFC